MAGAISVVAKQEAVDRRVCRSKCTKNDSHHARVGFIARAPYRASHETLNCPGREFTAFPKKCIV